MTHVRMFTTAVLVFAAMMLVGCATEPKNTAGKEALHDEVVSTLKSVKSQDPTLEAFLNKSYGYVVFPSVGKGGFIAGGSYGRGEVYEHNEMIGYADITQATIGLQAGGQTFMEIVAFENKEALDRFRNGNLKFAANASAVALKSGAGASAKFNEGAAVFTQPLGGLMFEVSIGGQSFSYMPK